nr:hypothetical protein [Pseudomonas marincola]
MFGEDRPEKPVLRNYQALRESAMTVADISRCASALKQGFVPLTYLREWRFA